MYSSATKNILLGGKNMLSIFFSVDAWKMLKTGKYLSFQTTNYENNLNAALNAIFYFEMNLGFVYKKITA